MKVKWLWVKKGKRQIEQNLRSNRAFFLTQAPNRSLKKGKWRKCKEPKAKAQPLQLEAWVPPQWIGSSKRAGPPWEAANAAEAAASVPSSISFKQPTSNNQFNICSSIIVLVFPLLGSRQVLSAPRLSQQLKAIKSFSKQRNNNISYLEKEALAILAPSPATLAALALQDSVRSQDFHEPQRDFPFCLRTSMTRWSTWFPWRDSATWPSQLLWSHLLAVDLYSKFL